MPHSTHLQAFIQPVLTCQQPIDLKQVLAQHNQDRRRNTDALPPLEIITDLVIVDDDQHPLGCLPLAHFLTYIEEPDQIEGNENAFLQPIVCLPANTPLNQFWQKLEMLGTEAGTKLGVVDPKTGNFLGLVDLQRLLPILAQEVSTNSHNGPNLISEAIPNATPQDLNTHHRYERYLSQELLVEISHDLKNPLTAVLGLLNVLQQREVDNLTERQKYYLELIYGKSHQLMDLVKDILLLCQLQGRQLRLNPEMIEIRSLCQSAIEKAEESITKKSSAQTSSLQSPVVNPSKIRLHVAEDMPPLVADQNALSKLLSYSLRHILSLPCGLVELRVGLRGGWIGFTITPSSPSVNPRFSLQVANQVGDEQPRALLERHLLRHLAHLQAGAIAIHPSPQGSCQVTLLIPPNIAAIKRDCILIAGLSQKLILIIAAEFHIVETLQAQLPPHYPVMIALSGNEALEMIQQLQPPVVFLHLALGRDLLTLLQERFPQMSIIVLGTAAQQDQMRHGSAQAFLTLPMTKQAVRASLEKIFPMREPIAPAPTAEGGKKSKNCDDGARGISATDRRAANQQDLPVNPNPPPTKLTVLHLEITSQSTFSSDITAFSQRLNLQGCRVIAIGNIEAAALMAQVWTPKVVLYTSSDATGLQTLDPSSPLTQIPWVVLDPVVADHVRKMDNLLLYDGPLPDSSSRLWETDLTALVQILESAAGLA